jgi:rare lipoprotein A
LAGAFFLVAFFIRVILPLHLISRYSWSKRGCASFIWRFELKVKKKMHCRPAGRTPREGPNHAKTFSDRIVLVTVSLFYAVSTHRTLRAGRISREASCAFRDKSFFAAAGALVLTTVFLSACGHAARKSSARVVPPPRPAVVGETETGVASWYGHPYDGRPTASGEIYDMEKFTAAHRTLPFETWLEVTNLSNGRHVDVRITDRGPFVDGRILDLSRAAAQQIDMIGAGTARVRLKVISPPERAASSAIAEPVRPDPEPAPTAVNQPARGYAVQAGAFADRSRAETLSAALAAQLETAGGTRVVTMQSGRAQLWRVLVGRTLAMEDATALVESVRAIAGMALVVPDPEMP